MFKLTSKAARTRSTSTTFGEPAPLQWHRPPLPFDGH